MTSRAGEWQLVGRDVDPVPASGSDVDVVAREMKSRADTARSVQDVLTSLSELDGWKGEAAEVFADKAEEVLDNLGKVVERYDAVAEALMSWADDVRDARTATWTALQDAEAAQQTIDSNEETTPVPGGEGLTPAQEAANDRRGSAQDDLAAARTALDNAMDALDSAADRAKDRIGDAAGKWDDGPFAGFTNWVRENADLIDLLVTILEIVAIVIGVILLVAVIFFTAPAWLVGLAIGVAALVLVGTIMLVVAGTGKRDWGDVAMAAVGLVLSVAGLGLGKLVPSALGRLLPQVSTRLGNAAAGATRATWAQRLASWPAFQNASRITNPANNLARWAASVRGNMATAVQSADDAARALVPTLDNVATTRLQRLLTQDLDLAQARNALQTLQNIGLQGSELTSAARITQMINAGIAVNASNLGVMIEGIPDVVDNVFDTIQDPPWSTRP